MNEIAFKSADIFLPKHLDFTKWSVIACDQYTSQKDYWNEVEQLVGEAPSTLRLTIPEVYLGDGKVQQRIDAVNATMHRYLDEAMFETFHDSLFYVRRHLNSGKVRCGLLGMVDLEHYDYHKGSKSLIRATEGTVLERIPPRVKIRKDAPLELPHIMLLIDDRRHTVVEPLAERSAQMKKVYDFDLMMDSGRLEGFLLDAESVGQVKQSLSNIIDQFEQTYQSQEPPLLFAVGDGNHSLATAKECFEQLKTQMSETEWRVHPARYALVEVVNIHDTSLEFEPIHRALFGIDRNHLYQEMNRALGISKEPCSGQRIELVEDGKVTPLWISNPTSQLAVGSLQNFLDGYLKEFGGEVDYIHGSDVVKQLSDNPNSIGFLLPAMRKEELFGSVIADGSLPRKTFSMGEAQDKRFYLEARTIR